MVIPILNTDDDSGFDLEKNNIIKKYFRRIFTVFKPEIRDKINKLNISEKKKKKLKKELAFLPPHKQREYLKEISETIRKDNDSIF